MLGVIGQALWDIYTRPDPNDAWDPEEPEEVPSQVDRVVLLAPTQTPEQIRAKEEVQAYFRAEALFHARYRPLMIAYDRPSPLHTACLRGEAEYARLLIEAGLHKNLCDQNNSTPLHYAARGGHVDVLRMLCDQGASVDKKNLWRRTPAYEALQKGHQAALNFLIESGATPPEVENPPP